MEAGMLPSECFVVSSVSLATPLAEYHWPKRRVVSVASPPGCIAPGVGMISEAAKPLQQVNARASEAAAKHFWSWLFCFIYFPVFEVQGLIRVDEGYKPPPKGLDFITANGQLRLMVTGRGRMTCH